MFFLMYLLCIFTFKLLKFSVNLPSSGSFRDYALLTELTRELFSLQNLEETALLIFFEAQLLVCACLYLHIRFRYVFVYS